MKTSPKYLVLALSLIHSAAWAANEADMGEVLVTAQPVARTVSTVTAQEIARTNPTNLKSLLKNEVGVEVDALPRLRQGNDGVYIRGLGGNRVGMEIDGIALPETQESRFFSTTGIVFGRGNFVDPTTLHSAKIDRSAASYGLAGTVSFRTLSPDDLLTDGKNVGGQVQAAYDSVDQSRMVSGAAALRSGAWQGMVLGTYRYGHETETNGEVGGIGSNRTQANPQNYNSRSFLTKHDFDINEQNRVTLTAEHLSRNQHTENLSSLTNAAATDVADDEDRRTRVSLGHVYDNPNGRLKEINSQVYWQKAQIDNLRWRSASSRIDDAYNQTTTWGLSTALTSQFGGAFKQQYRYGFNYVHNDITNDLDTTYASGTNGKPYADTKTDQLGAFLEAEWDLGRVLVTPGIRWDYYKLKPSDANGYTQRETDIAPIASQSHSAFSPRLGVVWKLHPAFNPYAQYSRGFKAPSVQQLTTTYGNTFGFMRYSLVGNPNLKPETVNNFELGVRGQHNGVEYSLAGFDNHYRNFIDYVQLSPLPAMILQYQNHEKARIYGGEAQVKWSFAPNWKLNTALSYAKGYTEGADGKLPINSIMPFKAKLGLDYERENWGVNTAVTHVARKKDSDISGSTLTYNPSKHYTLVDLGGYYKPTKHLSLSANINNIFDQKYWNWADLQHLAARSSNAAGNDGQVSINQANADAYTAPGRNFNIGLRYTF